MVAAGHVTPETHVWTEGMAAWQPAGQVAGLRSSQGQAQAGAPAHVAGGQPAGIGYPTAPSPAQAAYGAQAAAAQAPVDVAAAMFQAAFLANEAAGAVRLSIRQKKAMLGLKTVHAVWVEPVGAPQGGQHLSAHAADAGRDDGAA